MNIDIFLQTSKGTPMGDYLRRYWYPIASSCEFEDKHAKPIRIMSEDLTLFKDLSGNYGLVDRLCPHRLADLSFGIPEENGIRCFYHGWHFNRDGSIAELPFDDHVNPDNKIREQCKLKSYPVKECAGLLFAYLGPAPAPELPVWEPFTWKHGIIEITTFDASCNWIQGLVNAYDPAHFVWTHDNWNRRKTGQPDTKKQVGFSFEEIPYGHVCVSDREDSEPDPRSRINIWPYCNFRLNSPWPLGKNVFKFFVPVDDNHMMAIVWGFVHIPKESTPPEKPIWWKGSLKDENGNYKLQSIVNQDIVSWGGHIDDVPIDHNKDFLTASDAGVVMMLRKLNKELESVAQGNDAKGIIRDPELAKCVKFFDNPTHRKMMEDGIPREEYIKSRFYLDRVSGKQRHIEISLEAQELFKKVVMGL